MGAAALLLPSLPYPGRRNSQQSLDIASAFLAVPCATSDRKLSQGIVSLAGCQRLLRTTAHVVITLAERSALQEQSAECVLCESACQVASARELDSQNSILPAHTSPRGDILPLYHRKLSYSLRQAR